MSKIFNGQKQIFVLTTLLLLLVVGISACQIRQKGRKPSQDWSRSVPLGVFVRGDIDLVVSPDGDRVFLVWLKEEGEQNLAHFTHLDHEAVAQVARNIDLPNSQLKSPLIELAADQNLHFLWSSRVEGERQWDLWYSQLNEAGELEGDPQQLAMPADDVNQFVKISDGQSGIYVVWEAENDGGIYGAHIDAGGQIIQEPARLVTKGFSPAIARDDDGLFMTWIEGNDVFYGQFSDGRLDMLEKERITSIPLGPEKALDGPVIGLAGDWAYVLWSIFNIRGLEAGTGSMEYLAFSKDSPQVGTGKRVQPSHAEEQNYLPYDSAYRITQLALPVGPSLTTDVVREPFVTTGRGNELAVAAAINQDFRLDRYTQMGLLIFKDGEFEGYQMAGKTDAFSQEPILATDGDGNLHIAWREGGQGSLAYYAVTAPETRSQLDRMEANDVANFALNGGIEIITGVLFFPLACIWLFPGLFLIGLWHYWRGESDMNERATQVVLLISIIVSQVMKFLFLPTITSYVPFSAWMDIANNWEQPLRLIVPLFTMGVGLLVAWFMHRRTESGLAFFFWFTAADAILTLAIYGVTILGVF
ncbi:MAG: hypothetical protein R3293_11295 [Candidatus Promineifilaceae bacterium]|nr:hypothetical protein [Candidatus Promineifilaceae bacterium]